MKDNRVLNFSFKNNLLAMVIKANYTNDGICFLTDANCLQQIAYMHHSSGHQIVAHEHNKILRTIEYTTETIILKKGKIQVVLYYERMEVYRFVIEQGDIITLFSGGHAFTVIEEVEMIEIKQGPFMGDKDKTRF